MWIIDKLKALLGEKTIIKSIMILAIPAIIENICQVLFGVADTYFVSGIADEAIGAVGLTNMTMNIYISFFLALGIGTTALVSRFVGSKEPKLSGSALKSSLIIGGGISLFFGLSNYLFAEKLLMLLGAKGAIFTYAIPYFKIVAVPAIFLCLMIILSSALRGAGDTKTPMVVAILANIVNIILDYVLIFGIGPMKGLGIVGAGLATTLSRAIAAALLFGRLYYLKNEYLSLGGSWKLDKSISRLIAKVSFPAAIEKLFMRTGQLLYGRLIIQIGATAYIAHNIAGNIESFSYLPGMGFGIATATLVGQNLGAGDKEKAKKTGLIANALGTCVMVLLGAFFYICAPMLADLFTDDPEIISIVVRVLRLIALFQPLLCMTLVINAGLQGAGDTKFPMYLTFIGIWGIRVVGVYVFGMVLNMGLFGVWLAYALDITFRGSILMVRFIEGKWATQLKVKGGVSTVDS